MLLSSFFTRLAGSSLLALTMLSGAHAADAPGAATPASSQAAIADTSKPAPNTMRVHYYRANGDETLWGVYAWEGPEKPSKKWIDDRFMFSAKDAFGAYVDIPLGSGKTEFRFLLSDGGGRKNCNTDQFKPLNNNLASQGQEIWVLAASCEIHDKAPAKPAK